MERFFGFDLGDAESAVTRLYMQDQTVPETIKLRGAQSFISAYAELPDGEILVGESACYAPGAVRRKIRFKSRFLSDPESAKDLGAFAGGVLRELYMDAALERDEDTCFYVGCPAGWDKNARERYRAIFERCGFPPVRIISESRAALISACQSRYLQVGYDIMSRPVLVIDIGSSTTDFAYVAGGREVELQTAGEVTLGGGIMDEILLEASLQASPSGDKIREVFEESEPWKNYCEFAARRLKERYFSDEEYWKHNPCSESVLISYTRVPLRLRLQMDEEMEQRLTQEPAARLGGKSFYTVFSEKCNEVREAISDRMPELIFLTGGVSGMPVIRRWCEELFPEAVVINGAEPALAVARGLAWSGRIDAQLRDFRHDLDEFQHSDEVERIVRDNIDSLYRSAVEAMVGPVLEHAALPVFDRWRSGQISRLGDIDEAMEKEITAYLQTDEARSLLVKPVSAWLRPVADELEKYTMPICIKHHVPYRALSLTSYFSTSDIDIKIETRDVFALQEITILIDTIISIMAGLLCGGSGIALISGGIAGIAAGTFISLLVLLLGKKQMEKAFLSMRIPVPVRRLVPKGYFRSRLDTIGKEVRERVFSSIGEEKNEEIAGRLAEEISFQIEQCLNKMAEVVEIPLGK